MKYLLATIGLILAGAAATGVTCYVMRSEPTLHAAAATGDVMAWLRTDFHLTDAQFAAIRKLHESYAPGCEEHCRLIREATKISDALRTAKNGDPEALAAAEQKVQELRAMCATAITVQVRQVAALMSPEDGRRYLALVEPKIAGFDHTAAPNLRLNQP